MSIFGCFQNVVRSENLLESRNIRPAWKRRRGESVRPHGPICDRSPQSKRIDAPENFLASEDPDIFTSPGYGPLRAMYENVMQPIVAVAAHIAPPETIR
jgi:hypothetical protein